MGEMFSAWKVFHDSEVKSYIGLNCYAIFLHIFLGSEQRRMLPHCSNRQNLQGELLVMSPGKSRSRGRKWAHCSLLWRRMPSLPCKDWEANRDEVFKKRNKDLDKDLSFLTADIEIGLSYMCLIKAYTAHYCGDINKIREEEP